MLMRIFLGLAIIAALAAGTLNVLQVRDHINTLISQREAYHGQLTDTQGKLKTTQNNLAATQKTLADTQQQLTDSRAAQKKAEDTAAAQVKRADDLADKFNKATQERDAAQAELAAYKATGKSPQEVLQLLALIKQDQDTIAAINEEKEVLARKLRSVESQLRDLVGESHVVKLRADLKGKVVVVDPKWDFVVLDIGEVQGVLPNGELLVSRDGKLVAKVIVRTIEKDRCIANIMPGWKIGEVFEGDQVIPANPAS